MWKVFVLQLNPVEPQLLGVLSTSHVVVEDKSQHTFAKSCRRLERTPLHILVFRRPALWCCCRSCSCRADVCWRQVLLGRRRRGQPGSEFCFLYGSGDRRWRLFMKSENACAMSSGLSERKKWMNEGRKAKSLSLCARFCLCWPRSSSVTSSSCFRRLRPRPRHRVVRPSSGRCCSEKHLQKHAWLFASWFMVVVKLLALATCLILCYSLGRNM